MNQPIVTPKPPVAKPPEPKPGSADSTKHDRHLDSDEEGYTLIMGPPENGKTFSALMVSDFFEKDRLAKRGAELLTLQEIWLEDALHVPIDNGALDGIKSYGMRPRTVNLISMIEQYGVHEAWKPMVEAIATQKARRPSLKYLIADTLSALDTYIRTHTTNTIADGNTATVARGQASNAIHGNYRRTWNQAALKLGFDAPIFLMHMKPKYAFMDNEQQKRAMAAVDVAEGDMVPAMAGEAGNHYIGHASFVLCSDVEGQGTTRKYVYYGERPGYALKNRYRGILGSKFEADLGWVFRQIGRKKTA